MDVTRRIGLMGGTFDPIHDGHLVAAQETASVLGLEKVLFLPTGAPPHKQNEPVTDARHRLAMVRLAIQGNPTFELSTIELERPGPSYTVDTLRQIGERYPGVELYFIVGMDSLAELPTWRDPHRLFDLARVVAVLRAGWTPVDLGWIESRLPAARGRVQVVQIPGLDISSTNLRERVAAGRPIRYLVPSAVMAYIEEHGLYGHSEN